MRLDLKDGLEIAFTVQGAAASEGKTALLLHGFTGSGIRWQSIARNLISSWKVILPDLLGHGASSAPVDPESYCMEAAANHLALLIDRTAGEPVHLVGYSMGGRLALYLALVYPDYVRSLVLESASPGLRTESERKARRLADEALAQLILTQGIEPFVNHWEELPLFASQRHLPADVHAALHQARLGNNPFGLAGSLRGMGTGAQPSLWDRLGALTCPALLIAGELDSKFVEINQRMVQQIPAATLKVIPQAGHTPHFERPDAFIALVQAFWMEHLSGMDPLHP